MLINRYRKHKYTSLSSDSSNVHNYYERVVTEMIVEMAPRAKNDSDFLADVACVALNHLPPRYIRYDVDMNFYMSPVEFEEMMKKVSDSVVNAIEFVENREKSNARSSEGDVGNVSN